MEIKIWDGGLQSQEIKAIERIKAAFSPAAQKSNNKSRSGSLRDQLRSELHHNDMYPWKGYAGFRFVDAKGKEGEFDLVIVTHCNVLIIELKDWNFAPVNAYKDTWYQGDRNMGRSPVSVTRNKKFLLDNKLKAFRHRFTNKGYTPIVEFFVVMTGVAPFDDLHEADLKHTISLDDFLKLADKHKFNAKFHPHPNAQVLNKDFPIFDELFLGKNIAHKRLRVHGYEAKEEIFVHPKKVYKEFLAASELSKNSEALLRVWNFNNVEGPKALTPDGRAEIVSREREVLQHINYHDRDLYNHCLRSLTSFQKDDVTSEYSEVYELPPSHVRLNEFIGKYCISFSEDERIKLVKLMIAKFSDLHELKIAHRDIGDHSLWISPSKEVALSNFISAYHQPAGTVGDYRSKLSVGSVEVNDVIDSGKQLSPFQNDIHTLGVISWHILSAKRISPKSLELLQDDLLGCEMWYGPALLDAVEANTFEYAGEFFDALQQAEPVDEEIPAFDDTELDPYRYSINHSRQYREDGEFIIENDDKEVYESNGFLVKAWLNVGVSESNLIESVNVSGFLKRIQKISTLSLKYIPTIREFGIATKSNSLFIVMDKVEGEMWGSISIDEETKFLLIEKLINYIDHLHSQGLAHGDLHPGNVMILSDCTDLMLIDIPDYMVSGECPRNHRYSPENIDSCTAFERDNFAVMRMASELLGIDWGQSSEEYLHLSEAIQCELVDTQFGFKDLGRFYKSFKQPVKEKIKVVEVILGRQSFSELDIYPDNGRLYVKIEPNTKDLKEARISFSGVGGSFQTIFSKLQSEFIVGFSPRERSSVSKYDIENSHLELEICLRIIPGTSYDLTQLSKCLEEHEAFHAAVEQVTKPDNDKLDNDCISQQLKEEFEKLDSDATPVTVSPVKNVETRKLWKAILETETESHPNIEVSDLPIAPDNENNELIIPYESDLDVLGQFNKIDTIDALVIDGDNEKRIGQVLLKKSALNEVRLNKVKTAARHLKEGDIIYFRTQMDQASFRKRKEALDRILDEESVIPDLVSYLDHTCTETAQDFGIEITDEDFSRYDRIDDHGNKIKLNEQQRNAFSKLVNNGPVSLLQGPPGTGKTEFIAAFVHYLIEKQDANQILLVSQSHEAVNTAAERIRKHCARLDTPLELVRFSNREGAVSTGLKDVYSHAITLERKELFNAEYRFRVAALSDALGLDSEYISSVVKVEMRLFKQIDELNKLLNELGKPSIPKDDRKYLKKIAADLDGYIRSVLSEEFSIQLSSAESVSSAKDILLSKLGADYNVSPVEAKKAKALAKISRDMLTALSGERVNYDEFFARSRQLVTGTCVGIGQRHIGIAQNIYDWVIIDEAARSIASELAIAMQSGKRVLLVGDHLQLPPLYSDAHKKALARKLGIVSNEVDLDEVLKSDFARAFTSEYGEQAGASLLTQYRMAPQIGDLVSKTFYEGKLLNGNRKIPDIYETAPDVLNSVVTWLDTSSLGRKAYHHSDKGVSIYNRAEADQIITILKEIYANTEFVNGLASLVADDEAAIGIICMYGEQKRLLRQKFSEVMWDEGFKKLVKIDTVDSYQGKENRVIILSISRASHDQNPGFLRTVNRVNVAMSRAMDRLIIVGSTDMWKGRNKELPLGLVVNFMIEKDSEEEYCFIDVLEGSKTK